MPRENPHDRRRRLRRERATIGTKPAEPESPIKISTIFRLLSMLLFANIFGGK